MEAQTSVPEYKNSTTTTPPPIKSCRKKSDDASFLEDLKGHLDEFVNASMDEDETCFQKTISKFDVWYGQDRSREKCGEEH